MNDKEDKQSVTNAKRKLTPSAIIFISVFAVVLISFVVIGSRVITRSSSDIAASNPADVNECLDLLRKAGSDKPGLVDTMRSMLEQAASADQPSGEFDPALVIVSYRVRAGQVDDV